MKKIAPTSSDSSDIKSRRSLRFRGGLFLALAWLGLGAGQAQTTNYALGTTNLLVGPSAGTNSVVLGVTPTTGVWTATANAAWLHLSLADQSGTGGTNVVFSYDTNPGPTRSGTLIIGDQTLTVTQAGSTYAPAGPETVTLIGSTYVATRPATMLVSSGLSAPSGVAVDAAGNVYIADTSNNAVKEWTAADNTVSTLASAGLSNPSGVAVDRAGNVYIADTGNNAIKEWTAANSNLTTLVSSGLPNPGGVAVDAAGNVYIADSDVSAIKEWIAATGNLTEVVSIGFPCVAVDAGGNVYFANSVPYAIQEWMAANHSVATLAFSAVGSQGLSYPTGVAVDGSGNVYFSGFSVECISKWTAASQTVTASLVAGLNKPQSVAVDGAGNIYFSDSVNNVVGAASNTAPGAFQFTSQPTTNQPQLFYRVRSP